MDKPQLRRHVALVAVRVSIYRLSDLPEPFAGRDGPAGTPTPAIAAAEQWLDFRADAVMGFLQHLTALRIFTIPPRMRKGEVPRELLRLFSAIAR
ncbi:hypothetical protein ACU4GI_19980 [Cupriavidus basilensis]